MSGMTPMQIISHDRDEWKQRALAAEARLAEAEAKVDRVANHAVDVLIGRCKNPDRHGNLSLDEFVAAGGDTCPICVSNALAAELLAHGRTRAALEEVRDQLRKYAIHRGHPAVVMVEQIDAALTATPDAADLWQRAEKMAAALEKRLARCKPCEGKGEIRWQEWEHIASTHGTWFTVPCSDCTQDRETLAAWREASPR